MGLTVSFAFPTIACMRAPPHFHALPQKRNAISLSLRRVGLGLLLVMSTMASAQETGTVEKGKQPETGLAFWEWHHAGISIKLVQRLPDQTRAFFLGRGFPRQAADQIARSCVFQSIFHNEGTTPLDYDLREWRIRHDDHTKQMRLQDAWDRQWRADGISPSARIAFRWSLLPPQQHFEPGDYNWGMTIYGLRPGERFDLELVMYTGGQRVTGRIPNIQCPMENPNPRGSP